MRLAKNQKNTKGKVSSNISNSNAIGIDVGQHAIKMVQLSARSLNQIQLEKYVITKLPKNIVKGNKIQDYEQLVTYLQHSYAQLNTSSKNFVASLPQSLATIETVVYNPKEVDTDLENFAEFEVSQIAPIEEMNFDYQVVGTSIVPAGQQVLLTAAKKDDVEPRIEAFDNAGLPLSTLDIDLFAQNNAFSFWINQHAPELENEKIAVFGIHATQTYALIAQNGQVLYKQETPVSTEQLNQLIQRTYQVTEEKAAQMMNAASKPSDYQTAVADRFNIQVAQEIQRVLQFYYTTQSSENFSNIKHIFLTGTASQQPGLAETIFSHTNTATECIHPINYAAQSNKVDLSQLQIDAPSLTLAFGLALRGL
ncbi:type IV pilus assembly protein PilM [Neisseria animaloris]|uniref:type IV pilus assembly protein PilM n=1 Tax=Neisseria animaloris TaxID=326522 RepID=UPI000D37C711|nr:type IV pilus assembly protein PilM [Neisseria animaloris]